jgi:hypothetical protein
MKKCAYMLNLRLSKKMIAFKLMRMVGWSIRYKLISLYFNQVESKEQITMQPIVLRKSCFVEVENQAKNLQKTENNNKILLLPATQMPTKFADLLGAKKWAAFESTCHLKSISPVLIFTPLRTICILDTPCFILAELLRNIFYDIFKSKIIHFKTFLRKKHQT